MKYSRTKDGRIIPTNIATHELIQRICDAGYLKTLDKGSYVTIGKEWTNFYGRWVDIIDEEGRHYSIRPNEVKEVTRELSQADTIEDLICDGDILYIDDLYPDVVLVVGGNIKPFGYQTTIKLKEWLNHKLKFDLFIKDNEGNYIKRAKMNDTGELELL